MSLLTDAHSKGGAPLFFVAHSQSRAVQCSVRHEVEKPGSLFCLARPGLQVRLSEQSDDHVCCVPPDLCTVACHFPPLGCLKLWLLAS